MKLLNSVFLGFELTHWMVDRQLCKLKILFSFGYHSSSSQHFFLILKQVFLPPSMENYVTALK